MFEYGTPLTNAANAIVAGQQAAQERELMRQRLALGNIQVQQAQQDLQDKLALRSQLSQAKPVTTETGGYTPAPAGFTDNTAETRALFQNNQPNDRTQLYDPSKSFGDQDLPPGQATIPLEKYQAQTVHPEVEYGINPAVNPLGDQMQAKAEAVAQPTVTTTKQNPTQIAIQFWEQRDPQKAMDLKNQVLEHAAKVTAATGKLSDGADIINGALGTNYNTAKAVHLQILKDGDTPVAMYDEGKVATLVGQGVPIDQAWEQSMTPIRPGGGFETFANQVSNLPPEKQTLDNILQLGAALGVNHKIVKEVASEYQARANEQMRLKVEDRKDERQNRQIAASDARQSRTLAAIANRQQNNGTTGTDDQVKAWADKIAAGQVTLNDIPARGNIRTQVLTTLAQSYPGVDLNKVKQNIKFAQSIGTMNTKALLNTVDPLLDKLLVEGKALGNMTSPGANKVVNWFKENVTGNEQLTAFKNLRDDSIAEIERGLMGSGVLSDSKYNRAIKNVSEAANYGQLQAAIKNVRYVIKTRLESLANGPNGGAPSPTTPVTTKGGFKVTVVK